MNTVGKSAVWILGAIVLGGCAAAPTGPQFGQIATPRPSADKAMLIVFREHAEPTALAAKVDVGGEQVFQIPQKGFAYAEVPPGKQSLALRWPAASGTPGWTGEADWQAGHTYYYQIRGTAGHGWYFRSGLDLLDPALALATLKSCCKLVTEQKASATLATNPETRAATTPRQVDLSKVGNDMLPQQVIAAIGSPDHVSSQSTGKRAIPFYFGTDTRRVSWSYTGAGYVVFTRNEYNGELRVVETKVDAAAP